MNSLFDIVGPVMIGPSSSHTAGAARLGKMAARLVDGDIAEVTMILHGSFAATYRGHGTDKALLAGLLDLDPWDEDLKNSQEIAFSRGVKYTFTFADLGKVHPNTVKFIITTKNGEIHEIIGSSIGGGRVVIRTVDGMELNFSGERPMLVTRHSDTPGVISHITSILYENNINIGTMHVSRNRQDKTAGMYIETDSPCKHELVDQIREVDGILDVRLLEPI